VAGTIDEDKVAAMARTAERKLAIAKRIRELAVKHGLRDEDILFDPLVLPISTGIEEDRRNALETIKGTQLISDGQYPKKSRVPLCAVKGVDLQRVQFPPGNCRSSR